MHEDDGFSVMNVAEARQALTAGDIRSEVAFQNDVNLLLASVDELWGDAGSGQPDHEPRNASEVVTKVVFPSPVKMGPCPPLGTT